MSDDYSDRYTAIKTGIWWSVKTGDGTRLIGKFYSRTDALALSSELLTAFRDGQFAEQKSKAEPTVQQQIERWAKEP